MKRFLGVLVALAAVGAALASVRGVDAGRTQGAGQEAIRVATGNLARVRDALDGLVRPLESRVEAAVQRPEIKRTLDALRPDDPIGPAVETLDDAFRKEAWWEAYRREFPVTALSLSEDGKKFDLVVGASAETLRAGELVERVRSAGRASSILVTDTGALVAVADRIVMVNRPAVVLLLAKPLDDAAAAVIAERSATAILISDGKKKLASAGPPTEVARLAGLVGREGSSPVPADDQTWAAAAHPAATGLWIWSHADNAAAIAAATKTATTTQAAILAGAGLIAILSLFFAFRTGREPAPAGASAATGAAMNRGAALTATATGMPPATGVRLSGAAQAAEAVSPHGATQALVAPPPSNVFGRYTLLDLLGEGGMARVFTAVTFGAEGFRRKFVVKRLRPELNGNAAVVAQFIDEAKLASTLVHSNVVPVFDFGKVGDEYFMATEYILGRDLGQLTQRIRERRQQAMPANLLLIAVQEVLKALDYAHARRGDDGRPLGIVHRDVSPSNVLVSARGEVKLFDFGIVKAEGRVTKTEHGVVKGNVSFMSPEQARGTAVDARADLFSLGLVMFYCATGEVLYQGNTTYELLVKAATGPGPEELARVAALPAPLPALVRKALAVDPAERFASAAEFQAAVAPQVRGGTDGLATLMQELFGGDFRAEEGRFSGDVAVQTRTTGTATTPGEAGRR